MSYKRKPISLAAVVASANRQEIVPRGQRISEVFVLKGSGQFNLHFGPDGDPIAIDAPVSFKPDGSEAINGLFWSNDTAQAGITQDIYIVSGGKKLDVEMP